MIAQILGFIIMDVVLERILSLLPHDKNEKIVRGAKKDFAQSIGYDSGDIVSMWIKGTSTSYKNKLHEIAEKYGVSVEWLRGETDNPGIKEAPATEGEGYTDLQKAAIQFVLSLSPEKLERFIKMGRAAFEENQ